MSDKGYSTGGKKWLIIIGGVAFVAVLVVIILMAIPPNTYNAVQMLYRTTDSSFLVKDSESIAYKKYTDKVNKNPWVNVYTTETSDIELLAEVVYEDLDFYADYLTFADNNKNLKKNYKVIKNNLSDVAEHKENLLALINEANGLDDNSETYMRSMIIKIRAEFIEWLKSNSKAMEGLRNACVGSLGQTSENHLAFQIITSAMEDALNVIIEDYETLANLDNVNAVTGARLFITEDFQKNISCHQTISKIIISTMP